MEHTEPKHKPSPKHALDDVLSSLQDLMRNELDSARPPSRPPTSSTTRKGGAKVSANDVLSSLKGLIDNNGAGDTATQTRPEGELVQHEPSLTEQALRQQTRDIETAESGDLISENDIEIDEAIELTADDTAIEDIVEELKELPTGPELDGLAEEDTEELTASAIEVEEVPLTDTAIEDKVDIIADDAAPLFATDSPASSDNSIDHIDSDDPDIPTLNTVEDIPTLKLEDKGVPDTIKPDSATNSPDNGIEDNSEAGPGLNIEQNELGLVDHSSSDIDLSPPQPHSGEFVLDELGQSADSPAPLGDSGVSLESGNDEISLDLDAPSAGSTLKGKKYKKEKTSKAKESAPIPNGFVEKALQDIDDTLDYLSIKDDKPLPTKAETKPELNQKQVVLQIDESTRPPRLEPGPPPDDSALRSNPFLQDYDETPDDTENTITLPGQVGEGNATNATVKEMAGEENLSLNLPPTETDLMEKKPAPRVKTGEKPVKTRAKAKAAGKAPGKKSKARPTAQKAKAKAKPEQGKTGKKATTQTRAKPAQRKKPQIQKAKLAKGKKIGHQVEIDWDDIPVLDQSTNQIMTKTKKKEKTRTRDTGAKPTRGAQAPPKKSRKEKKVRDIAIKAIAKLNIQLRKTGGQSLEPLMVDRLQHALKEVLDTPGAKGDNKPLKKK
ncbi:MAG: hypothetical protein BMS9Abin11_0659 [Gammaproteobacteria bacterium]|nr:MAG: hypothetical protein BMS9Abin11_0659 [Gammaproteobacteria bacterium]